VLCPIHRGPASAGYLNLLLQDALTPYADERPERRYGGRVFWVGDRVAQLWNNYDKGAADVFDGTVGVVTVVIPLTTSSWMMLQRKLLYTWVTRARKPVVLAGVAVLRSRVNSRIRIGPVRSRLRCRSGW
jgi:exodeoxyribonuclease V alpha subunit